MRKISLLLVFLISFLLVSCENDCCDNLDHDEGQPHEEEQKEFRVRLIGDECAKDSIGKHSLDSVGSLTVRIDDIAGNNLFRRSFTRNEISSSMKITGINNAENAILTISGFDVNNPNEIKWEGRITNLTFKKGEKTAVDIVLYPLSGRACLPEPLNIPRFGHTSTLLPDGRILLAGGFIQINGRTWIAGKSVEIIDVESGVVEPLIDMNEERAMHEAVLMPDGSVVIFGGVRQMDVGGRALDGYPELPYTFQIQATTVEKYMPTYPKLNMRRNNIGMSIPNTTQSMNLSYTEMPFLPYQTYVVDDAQNQKTIYLIGGLDGSVSAGFSASGKVFAFDIVDTGMEYALSAVREVAPGEKDPTLMSAAGIFQGSVFSVGGRGSEAENSGAIYTASGSSGWGGEDVPNMFFTSNYMIGDNLYSFGGVESSEDGSSFDYKRTPAYRYNMTAGTFVASEGSFMTYGNSLFLSDVVYNQKGNHFIVLGGAGGKDNINNGNNLYQVVDIAPFKVNTAAPSHPLRYRRVLPKGTIDLSNRLFITGGTESLNPDGKIVNVIEMNIL